MASHSGLQEEVERVLRSRTFASAPQLRRFLEFCASQVLGGRQADLKESVIGVEVFGRPAASYDPRIDPIVRVMATRLRKRLDDYYHKEATDTHFRVEMPKGSYLPVLNGASVKESTEECPSVAVIPFDNFSGDASDEYLADAMTEALIAALAKVPGLRVISRTSVMRFKRTTTPMEEIARLLGVGYVMEGSVSRNGSRACITTQLIALPVEHHVWAETYERDLSDVFRAQQEIAREVAGEVHLRVAPGTEKPAPRAPVNPHAWMAYSQALYLLSRNREMEKALDLYEQAARLDHQFAHAHAGMAECCYLLEAYFHRHDLHVKARRAAALALELEPNLAEAHTAMAAVLIIEWNWGKACEHLEVALRADPNSSAVRRRYAFTLALLGKHDEAREQAEKALTLDPLSPMTRDMFGLVLYFGGWLQEAADHLRYLTAADPGFAPAHIHLALTLIELNEFDDAERTMKTLLHLRPDDLNSMWLLACVYARGGQIGRARAMKEEILAFERDQGRSAHYPRAVLALALGETAECLGQLERAFEKSEWMLGYLRTLTPLENEPRYQALLQQVGLGK